MAGLRELLAVALGGLLGILLVAAPRTALRLSVVGGPQRRRRGDYGSDGEVPATWVWLVRALGVGCLLIAAVIGCGTFF